MGSDLCQSIMKTFKLLTLLSVLAVAAAVATNQVAAAESCTTAQLNALKSVVGSELPARSASYTSLPQAVVDNVNSYVHSSDYAVGKPAFKNQDWNKSVHLYLPDNKYGACAMLFSVNGFGTVKSWGAEKLGKHAAYGGERVFIPSMVSDAKLGYHAFVADEVGGLTHYHWDINWTK